MSYIGNPIISTDFPKDTFSGNGSTTAFTMSIAPASVNAVIVVVSGITQDPSTYTISGTTLTFSAAPPTGTSNISVRHLGVAGIPNVPSDASVTTAKLASGAALANLGSSQLASANMPVGSVLQVVNAVKTDYFTTTSTTLVDVTGMSISITPKFSNSKILVFVDGYMSAVANAGYLASVLVRDSTILTNYSDTTYGQYYAAYWNANSPDTDRGYTTPGYMYLDSPATTSSTTYKIQVRTYNGSAGSWGGRYAAGSIQAGQGMVTSITAMEIAG